MREGGGRRGGREGEREGRARGTSFTDKCYGIQLTRGVSRVGCVQCGVCPVWGVSSVGCVQCGVCPVWGVFSVGCDQCGVCPCGCVPTCCRLSPDEDLKFPVARKYSICLPTSGAMGNTLLMMFARRGREGEGQSYHKRAACQVHTSALPLLPSNLSGDSLVLRSSSEWTKRRKLSNLSFRTMR